MPDLPPLPDFCWPVDPTPLPDLDDETDDNGDPLYDDADVARAKSRAAHTLRLLTGFRVGGCPVTVRPCRAGYREPVYREFPVSGARFGGRSTPWVPVQLGGTWLNIACGHSDGCSCPGLREVKLYGRCSRVDAVIIDGMLLPATSYRLEPGGRIIRTDGAFWPLTQNLTAPDDAPSTWSITYLPGVPVDGEGAYAAGVLAAEYLKAGKRRTCALPDTVTQLERQGVSVTLSVGAFPNGKTGIREVDSYIERWNPSGLRSPSTVWSPDLHRPRLTGGRR